MVNPFTVADHVYPTAAHADEWDQAADDAREQAQRDAEAPVGLVTYSVTDAAIASLRAEYAGLSCDTPQGYESTRLAIAHSRSLRGDIERRRVALKADALSYGRRVDGEAKRITALLLAVEAPLQANKDEVDNYKAQLKREREEAETAALEFIIQQKREAEEAALKAIRDAEAAQIAETRAALVAERAALDTARQAADAVDAERRRQEHAERAVEADRLRAEREALDTERRALDYARAKAERAEFERLSRLQAETDAVAKVERDHVAALARQAEADALLPDVEKVRAWVLSLRAVSPPKVKAKKIAPLVVAAQTHLLTMLDTLDRQVTGL